MLVSYNWLQKYFSEPLPKPKDLAGILNTRAYEIEKIEEKGDDFIIDVDVQPNRAHDSLSHIGIAREIATLTGLSVNISKNKLENVSDKKLNIKIEEADLCYRYIGCEISNVSVTDSPEEIKKLLESLGNKSINIIVDIVNLVMLEMGQPMHAFDADKLEGDIVVRMAKTGETMTTLDNKDVVFDGSELIMSDDKTVLDIAGIKGGKSAEVNSLTKRIILEAANFNQTAVRKTSQIKGIKTDASKRFENGLDPSVAEFGMSRAIELIKKYIPGVVIESFADVYPNPKEQRKVTVSLDKIQKLLGVSIREEEIEDILKRLNFNYENNGGNFVVTAPDERLDINIPEDVIEEIGRVYGYENIPEKVIENIEFKPALNKEYTYNNLIRKILYEEGFSEVMTSSFSDSGVVEVMNPVNKEKPYLRTDLISDLLKVLNRNVANSELFDGGKLNFFQIGKVFDKDRELLELFIYSKSKSDLDNVSVKLEAVIGKLSYKSEDIIGTNLDLNYSKLTDPAEPVILPPSNLKKYKPFSIYPFILRDIAVWVPETVSKEELFSLIKENAGELLVKDRLFDEFKKEGRMSYAFRLVFQSFEKTLTDVEVNEVMKVIESKIKEKGWEVR